ncbi:hypothetical protein [Marasmitruncus massiliensis]|uniref:hypothetical protein n=1 Tax=Marasmitruncus massiliensis TaxID=1944642 RepID=UPI000C7E7D4E|nr:hypothetical protein [Marasmitruncus massiliensis]
MQETENRSKTKIRIYVILAVGAVLSISLTGYLYNQVSSLHKTIQQTQISIVNASIQVNKIKDRLEESKLSLSDLENGIVNQEKDLDDLEAANEDVVSAIAPVTESQSQTSSPSKEQQAIKDAQQGTASKPASNSPKIHTSWDELKPADKKETGKTKGYGVDSSIYG